MKSARFHAQQTRKSLKKYLAQFREGVLAPGGQLKLTGPDRRVNPL